jgi:DNA-binding transcriptional regulator YdaS (Cro superfamily)
MILAQQNHIKTAIDRLGGPTKAAHAAAVSNTTIHDWIKQGRISNIEKARLISALSGVDLQQLRSTW